MKNPILTSILAGTFLLSGCSRFIKKESITIPEGYNPIFIQTLKSFRNEKDYVFGKAYARSDNLEGKKRVLYNVWGEEVVKSFSPEEYRTSCLENARDKAFQDILIKVNSNYTNGRNRFVLIDVLTAVSEDGKKCYYECAIGKDSLKIILPKEKKK